LWDFYMFQIHGLKQVHADPHPGNFLIDKSSNLIAIDFGCIKTIPIEFYTPYFELATLENLNNPVLFEEKLYALEILRTDDSEAEIALFKKIFFELLSMFSLPLQSETFDFSDKTYFSKMAQMGENFAKDTELRKMNGNRGSKHFLYINRTFFGLYNLLHDLKAKINTTSFQKFI